MPRLPLAAYEAGVFHVTAKAVHRDGLFFLPDDRHAYLVLLAVVARERGWRVLHFCLMGNHVHLLLRAEVDALSAGVRDLHSRYAIRQNVGERAGALFHRRFFRKPVVTDDHLAAAMAYIARNPVAAHLCATPSDWPWSAHRALLGLDPAPSFLDVDLALAPYDRGAAGYAATVLRPDEDDLTALDAGRTPLGPALRARLLAKDPAALIEAHDVCGWSQAALAAEYGVTRSAINRRLAEARAKSA